MHRKSLIFDDVIILYLKVRDGFEPFIAGPLIVILHVHRPVDRPLAPLLVQETRHPNGVDQLAAAQPNPASF